MISTSSGNKRIAINTLIIYVRMAVCTVISLVTVRYVLQALGQENYGLYNVVGGIVAMLNVISVGMHTTTRRFINVEMGKDVDKNLNKIFNVSLVLHIGFALSIYVVALTVGLWYIYNVLNVQSNQLDDAVFVYFISTTVSAIGIINIPFQGLLSAFEKFGMMAIVELAGAVIKILLVILLINWQGNSLRFYATGICLMSLLMFLLYYGYCRYHYYKIVKWNFFRERSIYKQILVYNNYTSLGALAYLSRTQGATMIVNYFFGAVVNGAFAIVYQIENFVTLFVNNLSTASEPQITQSYASGNHKYTFSLVEKISKYSMFIMILVTFSVCIELKYLLKLWLGKLPDGVLILAYAMLISLFIRSINSACGSIIHASGYVKWFEISNSSFLLLGLPLSIFLFKLGMPPVSIIIVFTVTDFFARMSYLLLMYKIVKFNVLHFIKQVFLPVIKVLICLGIYLCLYKYIDIRADFLRLIGVCFASLYCVFICFLVGMATKERNAIHMYMKEKISRLTTNLNNLLK